MNFWEGRKVFVTGADGFIGSHLTEGLVALGADVNVFVRDSSGGESSNYAIRLGL